MDKNRIKISGIKRRKLNDIDWNTIEDSINKGYLSAFSYHIENNEQKDMFHWQLVHKSNSGINIALLFQTRKVLLFIVGLIALVGTGICIYIVLN